MQADGLKIPDLLDAVLPLLALDTYAASPLIIMGAVTGDELDPAVEASYRQAIDKHWPDTPPIQRMDRFEFYDRTKQAFAVLMTGETVKYGTILLEKAVTPSNQKIRTFSTGARIPAVGLGSLELLSRS